LYTVVTNKQAKGKKGTLVAILEGTKSENIIPLLQKIPLRKRKNVQEITLDLAGNMGLIAKKCFPEASQVIDRFHVQQLATEALQEMRIKYRWEAIDAENQAIEDAKTSKVTYLPEVLSNGDTLKQTRITGQANNKNERHCCLTNIPGSKKPTIYPKNCPGYLVIQKINYTLLPDWQSGTSR
jgi:transposase